MLNFNDIKESYKNSRCYKHRYKGRVLPKQCCVIKKNGERCKAYASPGMKCCNAHGARAAKKQITHGACSKSLKINIMYYLNYLTSKEKKGVANEEYNNNDVILNQIKLTDILTSRALIFLNSQNQILDALEIELMSSEEKDKELKLKQKLEIEKNILNIHKVIQQHQKTTTELLKTRHSLQQDIDAAKALNNMAYSLEENKLEMLAECITTFIKGGVIDNLDQLKLLVESNNNDNSEVINYEYEYEQD